MGSEKTHISMKTEYAKKRDSMPSKSTESLSNGVDILTKNPGLFVPSLAPIVVQVFFLILAHVVFPIRYGVYPYWYSVAPNPWLAGAGYFLASIVGFLAACVVVDMANDIINEHQMDLRKSVDLVIGKLDSLILAVIISAICFMTFVLIPVALFIITITIVEGTDAIESTKRAFDFVTKNLEEVIVFIVVVIVVSIILGIFGIGFAFIPVVGTYIAAAISWLANVVFTVASVHFYLSLRQTQKPPPPPPPPPPAS